MSTLLYLDTTIGRVGIVEENGALTRLLLPGEAAPREALPGETPLLRKAARELSEYFAGRQKTFDLPLAPEGTAFQKRVWEALGAIPYGRTCSYGDIAAAIGSPRAGRAVGGANHRNPLPILIPCHRVVGADGSLTGYGGGLDVKRALLGLENPDAVF